MVMSLAQLESENDCAGEARRNCKLQTRPLVTEDATRQQSSNCLTFIKILSWAPYECLTPTQIGRKTIGRNITFTLAFEKVSGCEPQGIWQ
jgi:hypothetical protein